MSSINLSPSQQVRLREPGFMGSTVIPCQMSVSYCKMSARKLWTKQGCNNFDVLTKVLSLTGETTGKKVKVGMLSIMRNHESINWKAQ